MQKVAQIEQYFNCLTIYILYNTIANLMIEFIFIAIGLGSMIIAIYSIHNWLRWKESNISTIRAKVFLDKSFLEYNFKLTIVLVIIIGLSISLNLMKDYLELSGNISNVFSFINLSLLPMAMLSLGLVVQRWHKLLDKPKYPY